MTDEELLKEAIKEAAAARALALQTANRVDELMNELPDLITAAVERAMENMPQIKEEEREFLALAVKSQAQKVKLRQAIIEKTVPALIWSAIVGVGLILKTLIEEYMRAKGLIK